MRRSWPRGREEDMKKGVRKNSNQVISLGRLAEGLSTGDLLKLLRRIEFFSSQE
jgi:hypothetical protein